MQIWLAHGQSRGQSLQSLVRLHFPPVIPIEERNGESKGPYTSGDLLPVQQGTYVGRIIRNTSRESPLNLESKST